MNQKIEYNDLYNKRMITTVILTVVFGIATVFLGYLVVPLSAAAYATLLIYENKNRRILSYVLPVAIVFLDFSVNWVNGFFSEQSIAYVLLGAIIYLCYTKKLNKCDCAVILTVATCIFLLIGILFIVFNETESPSFASFFDFIKGVYYNEKDAFIDILTSVTSKDEYGVEFFAITREYAELIYHALICLIPAVIAIFAFIISGLTLKMFALFSKNRIPEEEENKNWFLIPSSTFTYAYIFVAILNVFASGTDWFSLTVVNLNWIILPVFAYIGLKFLYFVLSSKRSGVFAVFMIMLGIMLLGTSAISILSYAGAYISIITNKAKNKKNDL